MAPIRELTKTGEIKAKLWEGEINYVYDDAYYPTRPYQRGAKIKGNLTAGVGHLLSKGSNIFPEAHQWIGKTIPKSIINKWLDEDTDIAENAVNRLVKVKLYPNQWDVLYLFTFNIGVAAFEGSTLLKKINAGKLDQVPAELAKWNKTTINQNGKRVKITSDGLKKRRAYEIAYWLGDVKTDPLPANNMPIEPVATEIAEREPTKINPIEIVGAGATAVTATTGFANSEGWVNAAFGIAIVAAVLIGGAIIVKRYILTK